jgi:hypothetical protein
VTKVQIVENPIQIKDVIRLFAIQVGIIENTKAILSEISKGNNICLIYKVLMLFVCMNFLFIKYRKTKAEIDCTPQNTYAAPIAP